MKLINIKKISVPKTIEGIIGFLEIYLANYLREVSTAMTNLTFVDNFQAFITEIEIPAGSEVSIVHDLRVIPKSRIILRSNSSSIIDGTEPWTESRVSLKNTGGTVASVKVAFLKD
jgi:hypothetical protein